MAAVRMGGPNLRSDGSVRGCVYDPHRSRLSKFGETLALVAIDHNENPIGFSHKPKILFQLVTVEN